MYFEASLHCLKGGRSPPALCKQNARTGVASPGTAGDPGGTADDSWRGRRRSPPGSRHVGSPRQSSGSGSPAVLARVVNGGRTLAGTADDPGLAGT